MSFLSSLILLVVLGGRLDARYLLCGTPNPSHDLPLYLMGIETIDPVDPTHPNAYGGGMIHAVPSTPTHWSVR